MKKIIIIILLTFIVSISFAQQYTPMTAAGYQMKRLKVDSTLHIPSFCGVPTTRNSTAKEGAVAMDTCNNLLYIWTNLNGWSSISGGTIVDTAAINAAIALRVKYTDTAGMLQPYLRKIDTTNKWVQSVTKLNDSTIRVVKNAITTDLLIRGNGVKYSDTAAMLSPYLRKVDTASLSSRINLKLNISDTATMLSKYLRKTDTASLSNRINLKLNISDTSAMLSKYLRKTDTASLSARINTKLAIADTVNKWVQDVTKLNDSTIRVRKNNTNTDIILPKGTGGGGIFTSPNLQQVTDSGATSNHKIVLNDGVYNLITTELNNLDANVPSFKALNSYWNDIGHIDITYSDDFNSNLWNPSLNMVGENTYGQDVTKLKIGELFMQSSGILNGTNAGVVSLKIPFGAYEPNLYFPVFGNSPATIGDTLATLYDVRNAAVGGSGSVTSVATGYGLSGGTITTSGTLLVDSATLSAKYLRIADTSSMLNSYLESIDTTNKWVNSVTKINDTTLRIIKNSATTNITINPNLQQVTTTGNVISNKIIFDTINFTKGHLEINKDGIDFGYWMSDPVYIGSKLRAVYNGDGTHIIYLPITTIDIPIDTIASLRNLRNSTGGSSIVYVDSIYRTAGKDSFFYKKNGNTYAIKDSVGTNPAPVGYYGAFSDTTSQTAVAINTGYAMKFALNDITPNGISMVVNGGGNKTRITFANTGVYNLQWSAQFTSIDNAENDVSVWLRKNGTDVVGSRGLVSVPKKLGLISGHALPSWNFVLSVVAGEYYEFVWSTSNTNVSIDALPLTAYAPSTASTILTVTQQSGIMAGTGITAINSLTAAAQTMVTGTDSSDFKIVSTGTSHTFNLPTASSSKRGALSAADWTIFNGKIGTADTSVFQRKNIAAYSIMANNTASAANVAPLVYKDLGEQVYAGTITWTFTGSAPAGTTTLYYRWSQVGKTVNYNFYFYYATASSLASAITFDLPTDMPTPQQPTGSLGTNSFLYKSNNVIALNQTGVPVYSSGGLRKSATGYEWNVTTTSGTWRWVEVTGTYFVN